MASNTIDTTNKNSKKRRFFYILLLALLFGGILFVLKMLYGYGGQYGVGAVPDRILLSWVNDPSTSMAVTWRCRIGAGDGKVQFAKSSKGPYLKNSAYEIIAEKQLLTSISGLAYYYSANINGLEPETTYAYRVGNEHQWSEWNYFITASNEKKPFSFIFMGDIQNDIRSIWSRVVRKAYSDEPNAAFILYLGDIVSRCKDAKWGEWFYATGFIHKMIPCVATPGNHEYDKGKICKHWPKIFEFPKNGPKGFEDLTYYIDYQSVRIISLDSNAKLEPQTIWLRNVLKENDNQWTIIAFHHPVYFVSKSRDRRKSRNTWIPLFEEFGVDLVLQGHDHAYIRTNLVKSRNNKFNDLKSNMDEGTVYVVSVSGSKMYPTVANNAIMHRTAANTQLYQIISVDNNTLHFEAKTADGEIYDAFTLTKQSNGKKNLTNEIPDIPERK